MHVVLIPDRLAIDRSLKTEQNAKDEYENPSE